MAYDYNLPATQRAPTQYEEGVVMESMQEFNQLVTYRSAGFAWQWEEIAALIDPPSRGMFYYGSYTTPGSKKTHEQVDATGMMANQRFAAICDSLLTPANMRWHGLAASNPDVMKDRRTALWFERATRALFDWRYKPEGNFMGQNHANYVGLGAYGTDAMFVDHFDDPIRGTYGIRYQAIPLPELFIKTNHQNLIVGFCRWFRLNAFQAWSQFGPDNFPESLRAALMSGSQTVYNFLHRVCLRHDRDTGRMDFKRMPWASYYICLDSKTLMREGGYNTFPLACGRYVQAIGETYGRSPAMMVLPSLKTLNLEKSVYLKQGHRAADPVLLTNDDGLLDGVSLRPGAMNKGGVTSDGKPLVHILPTGEIQISKEMMQEERQLINDAFLVTLFQILTETPSMTATEVIERTNEKGILLAPTVGRQSAEYLGMMIPRELDLLIQQRRLDPMPPALHEARGDYKIVFTSPLSKAMRAQEAAGYMRSLESSLTVVNATQDQSYLDIYDFEAAGRGVADINGVNPSWMADDRAIAAKQKARANAIAQQQQVQSLPAQAAMIKAQAVVQKNGGQQANALGGGGALQPAPQGQPSFQGAPA